ncbi:MAG: glycosyltransferase [Candidatus Riflebacteria bacterium]|nr:glycosyltransferase [Candidatus Riflebacteria bacterium]
MSEKTTDRPDISVIIPVFNEEQNLPRLYERLTRVMSGLGKSYETIFVDDGSRDGSVAMLTEFAHGDAHVVVIQLARNFGQHAAIFAGFEKALGHVVVTLDADLQNPPEEIPKLLAKIDEGFDVVGGWREQRKDSYLRTIPSYLVNKFTSRMLGCSMRDYGCMLRAYRRVIVQRMCRYREIASFIPALATAVGGKIVEVKVDHAERHAGDSKYGLVKLLKLNYDLVTGFSMFPLQLLSIIGFVMAFLGTGFGAFLAVRRLIVGPEVEGVFTLFAILFFFVGTLYMAMGLLGEYVGRIYMEVRGRPRFIVARVLRGDTAVEEQA